MQIMTHVDLINIETEEIIRNVSLANAADMLRYGTLAPFDPEHPDKTIRERTEATYMTVTERDRKRKAATLGDVVNVQKQQVENLPVSKAKLAADAKAKAEAEGKKKSETKPKETAGNTQKTRRVSL